MNPYDRRNFPRRSRWWLLFLSIPVLILIGAIVHGSSNASNNASNASNNASNARSGGCPTSWQKMGTWTGSTSDQLNDLPSNAGIQACISWSVTGSYSEFDLLANNTEITPADESSGFQYITGGANGSPARPGVYGGNQVWVTFIGDGTWTFSLYQQPNS